MRDDDLMDQLLRDTMAADPPKLSPEFDARVMRRVRPRRLTQTGRWLIAGYAVVAAATAGWLMRDVPVTAMVAALAMTVPIALGASAYGRRITLGNSGAASVRRRHDEPRAAARSETARRPS